MKNFNIKHRVIDEITISNVVNNGNGGYHKSTEEQFKFNKPRFANDQHIQ